MEGGFARWNVWGRIRRSVLLGMVLRLMEGGGTVRRGWENRLKRYCKGSCICFCACIHIYICNFYRIPGYENGKCKIESLVVMSRKERLIWYCISRRFVAL